MGSNDNPFDPKYSLGLLSLIGNTPPKTENALASAASLTPGVSDLVRALTASTAPSGGAVSDLLGSGLSSTIGSGLSGAVGAAYDLGLLSPPEPTNALASLTGYSPPPAPFGLAGALSPYLSNPPPSPLGLGALSPHFPATNPPPPPPALYRPPVQPKPKPVAPTVKRKAF